MNQNHIILLHGWGGNIESMSLIESKLRDLGYKNISRLELPGHGNTPQMNKPWEMSDFANWLKESIKDIGVTKYILVGHSFGGKTIIESTASGLLHPEKIVLISSSGIKPKNSLKKLIFKVLSKILKPISSIILRGKLRYLFYRFVVGEVDYANTKENVKSSFRKFIDQHCDEKLESIDVPTLILWGNNDRVTPIWMGRKMNDSIKGSIMKVVEGTHGIQKQKPVELANYIKEFIEHD